MTLPLISGILLALLLPAAGNQQKALSPALSSLVESEREFAATSLKEGTRASFMKFFADDGISISPKPHVWKESAAKTPPPADPLAKTLYWEPIVADVSSSGDIGYTMGPASLKEKAKQDTPVWYGFYFSIWKKQKDGTWKVAVDVGASSTKVVEQYFGQEITPAIHSAFKPAGKTAQGESAARELMNVEKAFSKNAEKKGVHSAYQDALDTQSRALREGLVPVTGRDAILAYLVKGTALRWLEPMHAGASKAGDFGYTYGAYRSDDKAKNPSGYYVRVWRRDVKGVWKIVFESASPVE